MKPINRLIRTLNSLRPITNKTWMLGLSILEADTQKKRKAIAFKASRLSQKLYSIEEKLDRAIESETKNDRPSKSLS